jgi:hypothetical protein
MWVFKNAELYAAFELVRKVVKKNIQIFSLQLFWGELFAMFSTESKSASNSAFLYP